MLVIPFTQESEIGGLWLETSTVQGKLMRLYLKKQAGSSGTSSRTTLAKAQKPMGKDQECGSNGRVLTSKHETLSSNTKKRKGNLSIGFDVLEFSASISM
jgi:hypothetical protein